ncbi:MAG: 1-(5-phosphoribosyl)-5-[(5-phosphoribosylamino)methylideneamino]imidazole-4-carboxamide isomerase [Clostridiales bacterium]|nr:1-(5-phosphoribosyl)-5-[(5-phosphoribosylamino)methylideneamino]imidazole-4-carboxamide isomerase [Clostridiales bacterium]
MILFPAIDLIGGKAVRLFKGDYDKVTVYSDNPCEVALDFVRCGCNHIHIVDLEGAKSGETSNFDSVRRIKEESGAFCEIGGGVRSIDTVDKYINAGLDRVILGTAAIEDPEFLKLALSRYGEKIAVGVDIRDGFVAVKGWTEKSRETAFDFCEKMQALGVKTIICTDISKDGAMQGTNLPLYRQLSERFSLDITASGGVSSLEDIRRLCTMNIYAAIIGKAYYTGAVDLRQAVTLAEQES